MLIRKLLLFIFLFLVSYNLITNSHPILQEKECNDLPKAQREFRGAWVATVDNIDWPSSKSLSTEEQKKEAIKILDILENNHFNAVILQVRPQCDAFYKSDIEPWSYYLTGKQGVAPSPFYDPLEFWIEEAHKRGLELHAWINPYRAHHVKGGEISNYSVVKKHPEWVVKLKSGYWWLDPGNKEVQDYSYKVVMDITKRYDVDGIHFDDYFYPYPSYNNNEDFPDGKSYQDYLNSGGKLDKNNWRRENINKFIQRVYNGIKKIKPTVKFGLSPFGIWRPGHPESVEGFDQYEKIYADAKLWINKGWVDYWTPQIYWKISNLYQSYPIILGWWKEQNKLNRHFWPGIYIVRENNDLNTTEIINQIMITRAMLPESPGNIHYSVSALEDSPELAAALSNGPYKQQALIPSTPWFNIQPPKTPEVSASVENDSVKISWSSNNNKNIFKWVVYFKYDGRWDYKILTADVNSYIIPKISEYKFINDNGELVVKKLQLTHIAVSAVDKISNESKPAIIGVNNLTAK
ncbi:glycoside hydrolase family 10 protein [Melioribacteraceae bacterium 4301-Me]|uniref:glycoside hydrolase family 10 protein n=1 Tax=Pyranulibacter aquaticus TaxID=3163344 RepID=UPI00359A0C12